MHMAMPIYEGYGMQCSVGVVSLGVRVVPSVTFIVGGSGLTSCVHILKVGYCSSQAKC